MNMIITIPMSKELIERINIMGKEDGAQEGIQIGNAKDNLTILDFLIEAGYDDSNESDESLKHDELYQKEFDDQLKDES